MKDEGAYYVSRLKLNSRIYRKNDKPEFFRNGPVKKGTLFIQLDTEEFMNQLQPGQTYANVNNAKTQKAYFELG